jgi:hypothetical protein
MGLSPYELNAMSRSPQWREPRISTKESSVSRLPTSPHRDYRRQPARRILAMSFPLASSSISLSA